MTVRSLRALPGGFVPEDRMIQAAPDGLCAAHCVVAGFNVLSTWMWRGKILDLPRTVGVSNRKRKKRLLEKAQQCRDAGGKQSYSHRLEALAAGNQADSEDLKLYAKAIHHRVSVDSAWFASKAYRVVAASQTTWRRGAFRGYSKLASSEPDTKLADDGRRARRGRVNR